MQEHFEWQIIDKACAVAELMPGATLADRFLEWPDTRGRLANLFDLAPTKPWAVMLQKQIAEPGGRRGRARRRLVSSAPSTPSASSPATASSMSIRSCSNAAATSRPLLRSWPNSCRSGCARHEPKRVKQKVSSELRADSNRYSSQRSSRVTSSAAIAPRFDSLDAMKARHIESMRTAPPGASARELRAADPRDSSPAGPPTGVVLDNPADRRVAQGLIDYWKATLYTQFRDEESEPASPCRRSTTCWRNSRRWTASSSPRAPRRPSSRSSPADREVARRILLRLVRLPPAVPEFQPNPVPRAALDDTGNVGQVVRVIHSLASAGCASIWPPARSGRRPRRTRRRASGSHLAALCRTGSRTGSPFARPLIVAAARPPLLGSDRRASPGRGASPCRIATRSRPSS